MKVSTCGRLCGDAYVACGGGVADVGGQSRQHNRQTKMRSWLNGGEGIYHTQQHSRPGDPPMATYQAFVHKPLLAVLAIRVTTQGGHIVTAGLAQGGVQFPIGLSGTRVRGQVRCEGGVKGGYQCLSEQRFLIRHTDGDMARWLRRASPPLQLVNDLVLAVVAEVRVVHVLCEAAEHPGLTRLHLLAEELALGLAGFHETHVELNAGRLSGGEGREE